MKKYYVIFLHQICCNEGQKSFKELKVMVKKANYFDGETMGMY